MSESDSLVDQALLLIKRLERLSADSTWARRASGCRGALLKFLDEAGVLQSEEKSIISLDMERLQRLVDKGFELLEKAAREIPDLEKILEDRQR
jgi:hypothetical protein